MSLLGRKKETDDTVVEAEAQRDETGESSPSTSKTTAPKGRPTPRRDAKRRGPVAPAPMTSAEARRRRKEIKGAKLSRDERREVRAAQRARMSDRRERMMAGEEDYLLPRDQGPVRRYVRDVVDSRVNLLGLFMPLAFVLIAVSFGLPVQISQYVSLLMMVLLVLMIISGFVLGRRVNKLVDEKFPKHTESGWRLGWYAASRASQLRRMRAPRPAVKRGEAVD